MTEPAEVECPCCHISYPAIDPPLFAPRSVPLHPEHGICWDCMQHHGDGPDVSRMRGRQHGQMLRREYVEARRQRDKAFAREEQMRRELAMRPVQVLVRIENLDKIIVDEAVRERDEAYRRRDVAMGALSDVRMLHHHDLDSWDHCSCGSRYKACEMAQIADRWDGVRWWEQSQAGKAWREERHHLHRDHPALTDRAWLRNVYGA